MLKVLCGGGSSIVASRRRERETDEGLDDTRCCAFALFPSLLGPTGTGIGTDLLCCMHVIEVPESVLYLI
jgi:hypothetical protein